ncbi:trypsin-like peptidase domain-containing protein [Delftia tsuruhatensis]|uniref:trypsin-like peptidase domain-containing protein n=1 Tax=Delftia tsuruhatensis TaxID=180282 RepID=UPI003709DE6B
MVNIALPSVQSLLIEMRFNGQAIATGTGFVVKTSKGPHLITNRHNVTGRNQITDAPLSPTGGIPNEVVINHNRSNALGQWVIKKEDLYIGETPRWREHPTLGAKADFVALPLIDLTGVETYPYDLENSGPDIFVGAADTVSVIGFPFGLTAGGSLAIWATGFIASEPGVDFNNLPIQLIDCRSRQGQSGSPVIAYRSGGVVAMADGGAAAFNGPVFKFIGIYCGRINSESDIGIVWKASAVQQLIASI